MDIESADRDEMLHGSFDTSSGAAVIDRKGRSLAGSTFLFAALVALPVASFGTLAEAQVFNQTDPFAQNGGQAVEGQSGGSQSGASAAPEDEKIENPVAVFSGLDKITGRIISFDVYIGETVQFGALQVRPSVCYTRPATETPQTDGFVQVDEITLNNEVRRIFSGWMFADSPGLHAVEHSVYDIWLTGCKQSSPVPPPENYAGPEIRGAVAAQDDPLAGDDSTASSAVPVPVSKPFTG